MQSALTETSAKKREHEPQVIDDRFWDRKLQGKCQQSKEAILQPDEAIQMCS